MPDRRTSPPTTAERLGRMLVVVPYLVRHPGTSVAEAATEAGLAVEDRIELTLGGDGELVAAAQAFEEQVGAETLAVSIAYGDADQGQPATIEGRELRVGVVRAGG